MGASRPPLSISIADRRHPLAPGWACTTNLSPCLLAGAELTSLWPRPSPSARRAPHALACTGPRSY